MQRCRDAVRKRRDEVKKCRNEENAHEKFAAIARWERNESYLLYSVQVRKYFLSNS